MRGGRSSTTNARWRKELPIRDHAISGLRFYLDLATSFLVSVIVFITIIIIVAFPSM
jgi:hypothetical protein